MWHFSKKKKFFLFGLFLFLVFIFSQFFPLVKKKGKRESFLVKRETLEEKLTISGSIEAEEKVVLHFQTSGKLAWVGVKEGEYVKKYQAIASLDKRELKKKLEQELNDYLKSRWDFEEAHRETYKDKILTDSIKRILEKTQFDLNKAVLDVELQDLALQFANLWTPIEGIVTRISVPYAGVNVTPTSAEFEIVNPKTIYFAAVADQTEVVKLSEGLSGDLVLDAYPESKIGGKIAHISFTPKTGETGTVYTVKFLFPNNNSFSQYRLGMTGDVSFVVSRKENVLSLPLKFVKKENEERYVEVQKKGKWQKVPVKIGMETEDKVEIISGIEEGTIVYN